MKRLILLLMIIVLAVSAKGDVYLNGKYYAGEVKPGERIICDFYGGYVFFPSVQGVACCKTDLNVCFNSDPLVGYCPTPTENCLWPTQTFKPSFSYGRVLLGCMLEAEVGVVAGYEYNDYLQSIGCRGEFKFYCCPKDAIAPKSTIPVISSFAVNEAKPQLTIQKTRINEKNIIYAINADKWTAAKFGLTSDDYVNKAYNYEKFRCATGGQDINDADTEIKGEVNKKIQKGTRVFMFTDKDLIPLVTWCEK